MTHLQQPTKTSCGPTCVAILAGVDPRQVIDRLPAVRLTPRRQRLHTHRTNIGEMLRLLRPFGFTFGRRLRGIPPTDVDAILRVHHRVGGQNWHYVVQRGGQIFNPTQPAPIPAADYFRAIDVRRVSYYEVEQVTP